MSIIELPLQSSGRKPAVSAALIVGVVVLAAVGVLIAFWQQPHTANLLPVAIALVIVMGIAPMMILRTINSVRIYVEHGELVLVTGVGEKRIALSNLRRHGLTLVDLSRRSSLRPRLRYWGASMPGLSSGWFYLRNGEKALCMITARERVSYLRSENDGLSLLLSLRDPAALEALLAR